MCFCGKKNEGMTLEGGKSVMMSCPDLEAGTPHIPSMDPIDASYRGY